MLITLNEHANFNSKITGLDGIVIWIGLPDSSHGPRIKVSNNYSKMTKNDTYSITLPGKKIVGTPKTSKKDLDRIMNFIDDNMTLLINLNKNIITYEEFIDKVIKVNDYLNIIEEYLNDNDYIKSSDGIWVSIENVNKFIQVIDKKIIQIIIFNKSENIKKTFNINILSDINIFKNYMLNF